MSFTQSWLNTLTGWDDLMAHSMPPMTPSEFITTCMPVPVQIKSCSAPFQHLILLAVEREHLLDIPDAHPMYPILHEWNGIVIDTRTCRVVSYAYPVAEVDSASQRLRLSDLSDKNRFMINPSFDGSLFRLSHLTTSGSAPTVPSSTSLADDMDSEQVSASAGSVWVLSSEKFLIAHERRWIAQKSLGALFEEAALGAPTGSSHPLEVARALALSLLANVPEPERYTHIFMMMHPEHRHVVPFSIPSIVYMGSRNLQTMQIEFLIDLVEARFVPPQLSNIASSGDVVRHLQELSTWVNPGVRIYDRAADRLTLIDNPQFHRVSDLKGNTVHMIQHVLQMVLWGLTSSLQKLEDGPAGGVCSAFELGLARGVNVGDLVAPLGPSDTHALYFAFYYPEYIPLIKHLDAFVNRLYVMLNQDEEIDAFVQWQKSPIATRTRMCNPYYQFLSEVYLDADQSNEDVASAPPSRRRKGRRGMPAPIPGMTSTMGAAPASPWSKVVLPPLFWNAKKTYEIWRFELERSLWIPHNDWPNAVAPWNQGLSVPLIGDRPEQGPVFSFTVLPFAERVAEA